MMFVAHNLKASRVNLLMNDYAAGLPSPMAFLGLTESLARDLDLDHWKARVLPILHAVHVSEGRTKPEMEPKGESFSPIETVEDMIGTVEVSLLLDLPGCDSSEAVCSRLLRKRIAGGTISNRELTVKSVPLGGAALKHMSRGYAMVRPDQQDRRLISSGDLLDMERIARILFPETREPGRGWIVPVAVGHRLLEDPATTPKRLRARSGDPDIPHVFVEPCVGIAELISVRNSRLTALNETDMSDRLWSWHAEGEHVLGHPAYSPIHHD